MHLNKTVIYAIPGWGFSAKIFSRLTTKELTFVGLDYVTMSAASIDTIAAHLATHISSDNVILLGWSLGGLIALKMATLFPAKIDKLILISSQPRFMLASNWAGISSHDAISFMKKLQENGKKQITQFLNLVNYPNHNFNHRNFTTQCFSFNYATNLLPLLQMLFTVDLRTDYQNLVIPTLHIINNEDLVIKQNVRQLGILNPKITFINLNNCGHAGFVQNSAIYQNIIKKFGING